MVLVVLVVLFFSFVFSCRETSVSDLKRLSRFQLNVFCMCSSIIVLFFACHVFFVHFSK